MKPGGIPPGFKISQIPPDVFFQILGFPSASKFAVRVGISPSLMRHYKGGNTYISSDQAKKIESGLHQIGQELLAVNL